jgi:uncharacterized membrane protein (UPF0127 family)
MRRMAQGILLAALVVAGTAQAFQRSALTVETARGGIPFQVELAISEPERMQGLMGRTGLAPDSGMLFDFGRTDMVAMWMKNTYVPLDMLFIDENGKVVHIIEDTGPMSEEVLSSRVPVRAVLELLAGTVQRNGISVGNLIRHPMFGAQ